MNALDAGILVVVAAIAARGYFRGFFREAFGLVGWLGGGIGAALFARPLGPKAMEMTGLPIALAEAVAGLAVFITTIVVCRLLGWLFARIARAIFLGPVDRAGGLVLGGVKGVAMCMILLLMFSVRRGVPAISMRIPDSTIAKPLVDLGWDLVATARKESAALGVTDAPKEEPTPRKTPAG